MRILILLALVSLTQQLGHPNYGVREKATVQWLAVASNSNPHPVLLWGKRQPDAEIAARCKMVHEVWAWKFAGEIRPKNWPNLPWIDSLPGKYPHRHEVVSDYLNAAGHSYSDPLSSPHWPKYRIATRLLVYRLLLDGRPIEEIRCLLDAMVVYEKDWIKKHQHAYQFPEDVLKACNLP